MATNIDIAVNAIDKTGATFAKVNGGLSGMRANLQAATLAQLKSINAGNVMQGVLAGVTQALQVGQQAWSAWAAEVKRTGDIKAVRQINDLEKSFQDLNAAIFTTGGTADTAMKNITAGVTGIVNILSLAVLTAEKFSGALSENEYLAKVAALAQGNLAAETDRAGKAFGKAIAQQKALPEAQLQISKAADQTTRSLKKQKDENEALRRSLSRSADEAIRRGDARALAEIQAQQRDLGGAAASPAVARARVAAAKRNEANLSQSQADKAREASRPMSVNVYIGGEKIAESVRAEIAATVYGGKTQSTKRPMGTAWGGAGR